MKKHPLHNIVSLVLVLNLLINMTVIHVTADENNNNVETENPLNADYVLPAWGVDTNETLQPTKPAVYRDGKILIYHYEQLLLIGSDQPVKDLDYLSNRLGSGQNIENVKYSLNADYEIVQDIPVPRHTKWKLPDNFTGSITGTRSQGAQLYDSGKDTIYLYNPLQTSVMADEDPETGVVLSGDMDVSTFGTGQVIIPNGNSHNLTYSGKHSYIIAKGFSSAMATPSPSIIHDSSSQYDGRDFQGQVIKEINNIEYILIGNQEQLRKIGSDEEVFTPVYQVKQIGTKYVVDTDSNNKNIILYGGDADLLQEQNEYKNYNFQDIDDKKLSTTYYAGVNQKTGQVYTDIAHITLLKSEVIQEKASWRTRKKYSTKENYIIYRDIDLGGKPADVSTHWKPLMFSGSMTGAVAENGEKSGMEI